MHQMISGVVTAVAVMTAGAVPAMACGFTSCSPCGSAYVSPCAQTYAPPVYTGCNTGCGGWGYERLAEPTTQYYYVNQGPTYTGPGAFAPYPTYREDAVVGWSGYRSHAYRYGYGARAIEAPAYYPYRRHYRPYHYGYRPRYGYLPRVSYGPRYSHRYAPYHYGPRVLRRYY